MQQRTSLFNHFLGAAEQREWESDARAARQRGDLLAFLKDATQPGASVAQQGGAKGRRRHGRYDGRRPSSSGRFPFDTLKRKVMEVKRRYGSSTLLIEDSPISRGLIQSLKEQSINVTSPTPTSGPA